MPYSLVINLTPLSPIKTSYLSGRHIHALFLTLVSSVDPSLATMLHQSQENKAFTLSPLQTNHSGDRIDYAHNKPINVGTPCWFRISLLDDKLFGELSKLWLKLNPKKPWHLGSADLQITSILGTPQSTQPWANACTYEQLYEQASDEQCQFDFFLATPTAFRTRKYDTALPTPELIFNSLLKRWNSYSNIAFESVATEALFPSYFDIHTEIVADSRSKFIGCMGNIHYRLFGGVTPIQIKQINALADYALYCGIGRKTTMGMGMARRI